MIFRNCWNFAIAAMVQEFEQFELKVWPKTRVETYNSRSCLPTDISTHNKMNSYYGSQFPQFLISGVVCLITCSNHVINNAICNMFASRWILFLGLYLQLGGLVLSMQLSGLKPWSQVQIKCWQPVFE